MRIRKLVYATAVASLLTIGAATTQAAPVVLTGNPATDGWTFVGNSVGNAPVIWARDNGAPRVNYDVYRKTFTLGAGDTFSTPGAFAGSAGGALVGGSWAVGDLIIGIGVTSLADLSSATFKVDLAGTGTWTAAPSVGAAGGIASFSGGGPGSFQSQMLQAIANGQYAPQANQYKNLAGTTFPAGTTDFKPAMRGWALVDGADPNAYTFNELQWLVNYSEMVRLGMPVPPIGASSKIVVGMNATDVAFAADLRPAGPVPEPGTLALLALGLLAGARRLRHLA